MTFEKLSSKNNDYHANNKFVGVFVSGESASHAGLIYAQSKEVANADGTKSVVNSTREFHFIPHRILDDPLKETKQYLVAPADLDEITARGFASMLNVVSANKPQIRYGLNWENALGSFNANGDYVDPEKRLGLTCSTFVSELIAGFGHPAVNFHTWPTKNVDDVDLNWRKEQEKGYRDRLRLNKPTSMTEDDLEKMMQVDPLIRLQPSQIVGAIASDFTKWPVSHGIAMTLAQEVVDLFHAEINAT